MKHYDNSSRITNSVRNIVFGLISQALVLILNFIVRTIFIRFLGNDYLSVNGLYTNILTVLSLAEMGFGTAMVYSMYRPLAEKDENKLRILENLYAKVYRVIGLIVAAIGLSLVPFMDYLIKDKPDIENLTLIYLLFLANSVSSYFFAYKGSVLYADQKSYVCSQYRYYFAIIKSILQVVVLIWLNSYILFLSIQIIVTFAENIFIFLKVNVMYPFLKLKTKDSLPQEELITIKKNVGALVLSKIAHVSLYGTDNVIISAFVGIGWVGLLSNYTLIAGAITMVVSQVGSALTGSLGNYIAKEEPERHYEIFKNIDFMNYWIYGFCAICLAVLLNPFITLWLGDTYALSIVTVLIFCVNFLLEGMLQSFWVFRTTMGLFTQGRLRPLIAAAINILFSVVLAKIWGITGVLLGTTLSRILVNTWFDPYIIFKHGLKQNVKEYYIRYLGRIALLVIIYLILYVISNFTCGDSITVFGFIIMTLLCVSIPNLIFFIFFHRTSEFKYFKSILVAKIRKLSRAK